MGNRDRVEIMDTIKVSIFWKSRSTYTGKAGFKEPECSMYLNLTCQKRPLINLKFITILTIFKALQQFLKLRFDCNVKLYTL